MILTAKQEQGLKIAVSRYQDHEPWTCISGYAGSGKSTLVKFIVAALGLYPEDVCYIAYTGKAANVLKQKGCPNATTAHKLLYHSKLLANGKFIHTPRKTLEQPCKLIVVDEVSMLPKSLWDILLTHKIHVIALGDPEQLPPVEEDNGILQHPHIFLDEIMRQAQESEIIRLSMHVREGRPLDSFNGNNSEVQIWDKSALVTGVYEWADQIICATNANRNQLNALVRQLKGYPETPTAADKIIGLKNHWSIASNQGTPLTNGAIGNISTYSLSSLYTPVYMGIENNKIQTMKANVVTEDNEVFADLVIDYNQLLTGEKTLTGKQEYMLSKNKNLPDPPLDFAYGYAITCWKSQGSEWDKVLLFEEKFPFNAVDHRKYLYTGITRAKEKLVIARNFK